MFVKYIEETGKILGIGPRKDEQYPSIEVSIDEVRHIIDGKEPKRNYNVKYNPQTKDLELVNIHDESLNGTCVNDFIFEVPTNNQETPDILISLDQKNKCWRVKVSSSLQKRLRSKKIRLNTVLDFSITAKHDPNVLYRCFQVDFSNIFYENEVIIPFQSNFEKNLTDFSIFTSRKFDSYQLKVIDE